MVTRISIPQFGIDHNRCILYPSCMRVCAEIEGVHVWDVGLQGENAKIISEGTAPLRQGEKPQMEGREMIKDDLANILFSLPLQLRKNS